MRARSAARKQSRACVLVGGQCYHGLLMIDPLPTVPLPSSQKPLYISVIGGGRSTAEHYAQAEEVGRLVAGMGAVLVCGGLAGSMEAAARGAKEAGGLTVGILPGLDRSLANPYIDIAITTGMGHARNLAVVGSGDGVIAVGGEFGTLSEIGLAGKIGRPVVILSGWRVSQEEGTHGVWYASSPKEAVALLREALGLRSTPAY